VRIPADECCKIDELDAGSAGAADEFSETAKTD
jgi:hypothetical protein